MELASRSLQVIEHRQSRLVGRPVRVGVLTDKEPSPDPSWVAPAPLPSGTTDSIVSTPTLPQHVAPDQRAKRDTALTEARTHYTWAHSHTYQVAGGKTLVLEPIAVLAVDDQHPLPSSQKLTLVQIVDIASLGLDLVGNILISLTNLFDKGAVQYDAPPPPPPPKGLREVMERVVERVEHVADEAKKLVRGADDGARDVLDLIEATRSATDSLEARHEEGRELLGDARRALTRTEPVDDRTRDSLSDRLGDWLEDVLEVILRRVSERLLVAAGLSGKAQAIGDFARQFQTLVVPDVMASTMSDAQFARMRVAGPNPLLITKVDALPSNFPVDPKRVEELTGQPLADALSSNRVFLADYAALADVEAGLGPAGQKYVSAPLALFVLSEDRRQLEPVAIQCTQTPGNSSPIIYCDDGEVWSLAKLHVQSADGNYHELVSHLGLTHLLIEPFVVATHRSLAPQHPVFVLLLPHFQGTLFINEAAITSLVKPGGTVDQLLGGTIEADWAVTTTALGSLDFNAHMLPNELRARGVADDAVLPSYPYRDDARLLWDAIESWVHDYLSLYYDGDDDVIADPELQAWYEDLVSETGGGIQGLGEPGPEGKLGIFTVAYLTQVLTMVIFTGSAQHAAVNFPQRKIMSYTPAMPLSTYAPPPTNVSGYLPASVELDHLPPLQMGLLQLLVGQLLGGIYFTRLGDYDRHQRAPWFSDPRVAEPLMAFQGNLRQVEATIGARNLERAAYGVLLPSRIPQSINI